MKVRKIDNIGNERFLEIKGLRKEGSEKPYDFRRTISATEFLAIKGFVKRLCGQRKLMKEGDVAHNEFELSNVTIRVFLEIDGRYSIRLTSYPALGEPDVSIRPVSRKTDTIDSVLKGLCNVKV